MAFASAFKRFQAGVKWANENPGAAAVGSSLFAALGTAGYGAFTLYEAQSTVAGAVQKAYMACRTGRAAYVKGDTHGATTAMTSARQAADEALKCVSSTSRVLRPFVCYIAGTTSTELLHLSAHTHYHCAVLDIRNQQFESAAQLLERSADLRDQASAAGSTATEEKVRAVTRKADVKAWANIRAAKKIYSSVVEGNNQLGESFFTVRAHNNFGILWYSLGYDDRAAGSFRSSARLADKLSALTAAEVRALVEGGHVVSDHLRSLGRGQEVSVLHESVAKLLLTASQKCGVVDVAHLPSGSDATRMLEAAERLKLTWRKRVTARVNLLQLLTTTWPLPPPYKVADALAELQLPADVHADSPFQKWYLEIDASWLAAGGTVRVAYAIAAGLTNLLASGSLVGADDAEARALAQRALKLGSAHLADASPKHQGIFEYHHAAFHLLQGNAAAASRYITTALVNHGAEGAAHRTQRDTRLRLQALLLCDPPPSRSKAEKVLVQRDRRAGAEEDVRDVTGHNPEHPVLLRLDHVLASRRAGAGKHAHGHHDDALVASGAAAAASATTLHGAADLMKGLARVLAALEAATAQRC